MNSYPIKKICCFDHFNRIICAQVLFAMAVLMLPNGFAHAQEITDSQKSKLKRIASLVDRAGKLFKSKDYKESAKRIRSAQRELMKLSESSNTKIILELKNDYLRILKAQKLLETKEEVFDEMPEYETLWSNAENGVQGSSSKDAGNDAIGDSKSEGSGNKEADADVVSDSELVNEISFTKQVAPVIVEHCGQCHIDEDRGKYSAANYVALKKGSRKGRAVKPRDAAKSRIVMLIESGTMPPKSELPSDQLKILKDWIDQGAKFDGTKKEEKSNIKDFVKNATKQDDQ